MPVIDADAHVDENDDTWDYIPEGYEHFRPSTMVQAPYSITPPVPYGNNRYWFIDGSFHMRRFRSEERTRTTEATRELKDIEARLRHMDALGIDYQVCYPTLLATTPTGRAEVELALTKAYNRWMAAKSKESGGRIRYLAILPMLTMDEAVKELEFVRENGACGVARKGIECGRPAGDPYFHPLYEAARDLDMAICFHTGTGDPQRRDADFRMHSPWHFNYPVFDAFTSLVLAEIPNKFPGLRFGFVEAMASWVPLCLADLRARSERTGWMQSFDLKTDLFSQCNFYVACQTVEDLPYIIQHTGEDRLIAGTDYSHADQSAEIETLNTIRQWGEDGYITRTQARKILEDNPARLYGIR